MIEEESGLDFRVCSSMNRNIGPFGLWNYNNFLIESDILADLFEDC